MDGHQVAQPRRALFARARATGADNRLLWTEDLRLHEQVAEGRMERVGSRRSQHYFRVAGDFDGLARTRGIGDADAPQLDIVLRRDGDLGMRVESQVAAPELRARVGEDGFVTVGRLQSGLEGGRPEFARGQQADVAEGAPVVAGAVFAPARHREIVPPAVSARSEEHTSEL